MSVCPECGGYCPECGGYGDTESIEHVNGRIIKHFTWPCPLCHGTGLAQQPMPMCASGPPDEEVKDDPTLRP
jgi:DnaJ-class molecular chaperone